MSYPPGQQPPTWGPQQPPTSGPQPPRPGQPPPGWRQPPPYYSVTPGKSGANSAAIVVAFVGILVLIVGIAAVVIMLSQPSAPAAPCAPGRPCAPAPSLPPVSPSSPTPSGAATLAPATPGLGTPTPPPGSPAPVATPTTNAPVLILGGSNWRSATLDYGFEYDAETFQLSQSTDDLAVLDLSFFDAQVVIQATTGDVTPEQMVERQISVIDGFMIGRTKDTDDYDAVLGPEIGYIDGEGSVYSGILTGSDGTPAAPGGVTILASTNGRITVAIVVIVAEPDSLFGSDTVQYIVRSAADDIVKTFDWGAPPI